MVEELDVNSNEVLCTESCVKHFIVRKWKYPKEFGEANWEFEIGTHYKI